VCKKIRVSEKVFRAEQLRHFQPEPVNRPEKYGST
jgi:hypothetical protein